MFRTNYCKIPHCLCYLTFLDTPYTEYIPAPYNENMTYNEALIYAITLNRAMEKFEYYYVNTLSHNDRYKLLNNWINRGIELIDYQKEFVQNYELKKY